jgi:hypothetical protein
MKQINIRLTDGAFLELQKIADKRGMTATETARTIIIESITTEKEEGIILNKVFAAMPYILDESIKAKKTGELIIRSLKSLMKADDDFLAKFIQTRDSEALSEFQKITEQIN